MEFSKQLISIYLSEFYGDSDVIDYEVLSVNELRVRFIRVGDGDIFNTSLSVGPFLSWIGENRNKKIKDILQHEV